MAVSDCLFILSYKFSVFSPFLNFPYFLFLGGVSFDIEGGGTNKPRHLIRIRDFFFWVLHRYRKYDHNIYPTPPVSDVLIFDFF